MQVTLLEAAGKTRLPQQTTSVTTAVRSPECGALSSIPSFFFILFYFLDKTIRKCHLHSEECFAQGRIGRQAQAACTVTGCCMKWGTWCEQAINGPDCFIENPQTAEPFSFGMCFSTSQVPLIAPSPVRPWHFVQSSAYHHPLGLQVLGICFSSLPES